MIWKGLTVFPLSWSASKLPLGIHSQVLRAALQQQLPLSLSSSRIALMILPNCAACHRSHHGCAVLAAE
jgi:hypothetical protein